MEKIVEEGRIPHKSWISLDSWFFLDVFPGFKHADVTAANKHDNRYLECYFQGFFFSLSLFKVNPMLLFADTEDS
jgi:hypothetical protein